MWNSCIVLSQTLAEVRKKIIKKYKDRGKRLEGRLNMEKSTACTKKTVWMALLYLSLPSAPDCCGGRVS